MHVVIKCCIIPLLRKILLSSLLEIFLEIGCPLSRHAQITIQDFQFTSKQLHKKNNLISFIIGYNIYALYLI